ncbi:uncharacterized protein LOC130744096 [Lotus japonicus]|uniref:uncharacterized protein LOC130744096 n=1 Tax=Lotus japonicus TaxID=34305 RepID=UPI00258E15AD|nr:uncharacterized protein LOC130744096 [Lotus japonicus]
MMLLSPCTQALNFFVAEISPVYSIRDLPILKLLLVCDLRGLDILRASKGCTGVVSNVELITNESPGSSIMEFWKHADCDDLQVVSYVLGKKIIITERSIALLLGAETINGFRFQTSEPKTKGTKDKINKVMYSTWKPGKGDRKTKDLHPDLRIWHKIILKCFNPRPKGSSPDYINFNQKVMLYFIKAHKPTIKYIPFGRLLSDIFIESKLIEALTKAGCSEDLSTTVGDALAPTSMEKMGLIDMKVEAEYAATTDEDAPDFESPKKNKTKRKQEDTDETKDDSDGDDDEQPPQKTKKKVRIATKVIQLEPTRAAITSRVTRSSVRNSSKFTVLTDEDDSDVVVAVSNLTPTLALPSPTPESTPAFETQTSEKPDSEPKSPYHSDRETLSPAPSVSFPTNTQISSPSNKSESNRQFVRIASERISEIPEHFITVPSPNRYPGPRPEPLVAEDWSRLCNWMHNQIDEMMLLDNEEREARINAARQRFEARTRRRQALHERRLREKLYTKIEETRKKKEEAEVVARLEAALRESARLDALEQAARLKAEAAALKAQVLAPVQVTNITSSSAQAPHSDQAAPSAPVQSDSKLDLIERRLDSQ